MNRVPEPSPAARTRISKTGRDRIAAESVIPDMYGKPGFILGITAQRAVFQQGLKTSRLTFGALTLCSLVFLGVLLLFAERTVVRKLEEFSRKSEEIAIAPGRPERMDPTGSLEFQSLAHSINRMLDSLDSSSRLIRDNEEKYRAVLHQSCDAIFIIDPDTREILEANQAFFAMTGYSQQDVPGLLMDAVTKDTESIKEKIEKVLSKGEIRVTDRKYHRKDGIRLEVEVAANTIRTGRKTLICLLVRDVTARNEEQRKIRDMAITDMLTGIPNRNYLMQRAVQEFERIRRARSKKISKVSMGCIMIDMDHFKAVNDSLGHLCGDEVLRQCAGRIAGSVRPYDIIGRYGGEEFAVFLSDTELEQTRIVAERIWHAIRSTPFTFKEHSFQMTASIGLAILSPEDLTLSDLLKRADDTLYTAKRNGRDRVEEAPPSSIPLIS